jgi:nucleoside phosphorylase
MPKPLIVVASEREGLGLVENGHFNKSNEFHVRAGTHEAGLGLYCGRDHDVLISGVMEHHMTAATALACSVEKPSYVVNFGACGTYGDRFGSKSAPAAGDVVMVSQCLRFDVGDNLHWVPPREIETAEIGLPTATCVTGSRYSRPSDYKSEFFPRAGHVEDMEIYGLAVLLETLEVPLYGIKFVTNEVGPMGREQFRRNVLQARAKGCIALDALMAALP